MIRPAQRVTALAIALTIATLGLGARTRTTQAASEQELQQQVEEATSSYNDAVQQLAQVQEEIDENQAKIDRIEKQLPAQKEHAAESLKTLYLLQQSSAGLVDLLLSADDFNEFITTITYLDRIQSENLAELEELSALEDELQETERTLEARQMQANLKVEAAQQAQEDAIAAREAVRQQAIEQAKREAAEAQAALEAAAKEAEEGKTFTNASGQETKVEAPSSTKTVDDEEEKKEESSGDSKGAKDSKDEQSEASDRNSFVSKWTPRIDAYLAGSPLSGYGKTFAEAAWDYGVDPRWSPAISCVESSKGAVCFLPHNAWGWGSSSWDDWDTAIRSHVAGLAAGYGYTISVEAAKKYCPPTWEDWYSSVLAEMNSI